MKRGVKLCPQCNNVMHEDIDDRLDDYWKCPNCGTKIRIFHKPIRRQSERPFDGVGIA